MYYAFAEYSLDPDRRELRRGPEIIAVEPQTFDLLLYLVQNRQHVVSKDDLIATVWKGRIVSESTLSSQITNVRHAIGDGGGRQLLIRTLPRKGFRFVGHVQEHHEQAQQRPTEQSEKPAPTTSDLIALSVSLGRPERRQLTVMICKLAASGVASEGGDPEELMVITTRYHDCVRRAVAPYDGFVAKALGDEVIVYFGYPRAHEDDAERAIRAGIAVIADVTGMKARTTETPNVRVAVATGLTVVGNLNPEISTDPSAVGEAMTMATDLLARAKPGWLVVPVPTRRLIGDLFSYKALGPPPGKSASDPAVAWQVTGESTVASRFEALRPGHTKLIGREEELDLLRRRWNQIKDGEGRVVLIYGEPGIGKSRLVVALQESIDDEPHKHLHFYCSPHRTQTALYPAINQLERASGFSPADNDATKLRKLETLLSLSSQDLGGDSELFAELLAIPGRARNLSISPQRRKELTLQRLVDQLAGLAAREPVLMVFEDAHWVDPTTRELFDIVVERVRTLPVLLIVTYRPEFSPPWLGQSHVTALTLNRLGRRANLDMILQVAKGKKLPSALIEQIVSRTDGIPLFIEEVTKSVLESGVLREESGNYVLPGSLPVLAVPATLQASLVARLDRLSSWRAVLQAGAALGREFTFALLRAVCDLSDSELESSLQQLVASELVHQRGVIPHALYTFKHALVQDAAYETMLKSHRVQVHTRIVDVLEHEFEELQSRNPDVLAYHCTEAQLYEKAIEYWLRSTRMALDRSAGAEARAQIEKAKALLTTVTDPALCRQLEGRVHVALGDTLVMTQGFASPDVAATLLHARDLLDESVYPIESLHALGALCNYHLIRSEAPKGLKLAEPFLQRPVNKFSVAFHQIVGTAYLHIGNFNDAQVHLESALALYDEEACRPIAYVAGFHVRSFTLIWLSLTYLYLGKLRQAATTMDAAVADARSRLHPFTLVSALLASARFFLHTRDLAKAIAAIDEGYTVAVDQRSPYHVSRATILRAVSIVESGRALEGISLMDHGLAEHRKTGANFQSSFNLSCLAEAYAQAGNFERALDFVSAAIAEVEHSGERWWEAEAKRIKGNILLAASPRSWRNAEDCFLAALDCAKSQNAKFWQLRAAQNLASLWTANGRKAEARKVLDPICRQFTDGVDFPDLIDARRLLDGFEEPASA
jgi:DNA-binding winged helix-turn-helix (wHTH) protein/tetratricopeptide (TPR) repeat protein